ncbi:hypothetical protein F5888DRAFT_224818 [Russula emetica]|nr:hypothetical protein F5888DRAFT_224818 [Russula emetica]
MGTWIVTWRAHLNLIYLPSSVAKFYYLVRLVSIPIMTALPPIPPHIVRITAPLLLGDLWNWGLFGVLVVQTYVYSYNFSEDNRLLKILVYTVFVLETVQTALTGADLYYWFASGFGDMNHLASPFASNLDTPLIGSLVSAMVQYFCAYRVWALSNKQSRWFCLIICLCSTLNAVGGFTGGIYARIQGTFATSRILKNIAISWLSMNAFSDILIASAMLYYLTKRRKEMDGFFHNNAMVKVVRLTIETNVLTTSVGIVSLLLIFIFPHENWYTCPTAILGKLYSNTLLVSLNNRISIRSKVAGAQVINRNQGIAFAVTPRSDSSTDITYMESEQSSIADKFPGRLSGTV